MPDVSPLFTPAFRGGSGGDGYAKAVQRAWRVCEWAQLHGDDLPGVLRLDEEADAETISIVADALLAADDAYHVLNAYSALAEAQRRRPGGRPVGPAT